MGFGGLKKTKPKLVNARELPYAATLGFKIMSGGENVKIKKRYHYLEPPPGH
jgi:hypothetical protein